MWCWPQVSVHCEYGNAAPAGGYVHRIDTHPFSLRQIARRSEARGLGFEPRRPGGEWLDHAAREFELPVAQCGYPIPDRALRWGAEQVPKGYLVEDHEVTLYGTCPECHA